MVALKALDPRFPLETCNKKEDAVEWMMHYGAILKKKGLQKSYGVYIKQIPRKNMPRKFWAWGVFVDKYDS